MNKFLILAFFLLLGLSLQQNQRFLSTSSLDENEAKKLAKRFKPIYVFEDKEEYFPLSIEELNIDWSTSDINNSTSFVSYNYTGPNELNRSAPVYVSVYENQTDNTYRITYALLYGFNGCGPYFEASLETNFGFEFHPRTSICPLGKHYGDLEHISIFLSKQEDRYSIVSLKYANHDSSHLLTPEEVIIKNGRPIVYVAKGSHASYHRKGSFEVLKGWNITGHTFSTSGYVLEDISGEREKWSEARLRLLKLNGEPTSFITKEETYLSFLYKGRLGQPIENQSFNYFEKEMNAYAKALEKISPQASQMAANVLFALHSEVLKQSCFTLAHPSRTWW